MPFGAIRRWLESRESAKKLSELRAKLADPQPPYRIEAVEAIAELGPAGAELLLPRLEPGRETNRLVLIALAKALAKLGERRAAPGLARLVSDEDMDIGMAAADALGRLGAAEAAEPLLAALLRWGHVAKEAAKALGRLKAAAALGPLIEGLTRPGSGSPGFDAELRACCAESLGLLGRAEAAGPLWSSLRDPEYLVQRAAALSLEALGARPAGEEDARRLRLRLLAARGDLEGLIREGAAALLTLEALLIFGDPGQRPAVARALGLLPGPGSLPALYRLVSDHDQAVALEACRALGALRDPGAVPYLRRLLAQLDPNRRREPSLWATAERTPDSDRRSAELRSAAAQALQAIG